MTKSCWQGSARTGAGALAGHRGDQHALCDIFLPRAAAQACRELLWVNSWDTTRPSCVAAQAERSAAQEALDALTERHTALTERHATLSDEAAELRSAAAAASVGLFTRFTT